VVGPTEDAVEEPRYHLYFTTAFVIQVDFYSIHRFVLMLVSAISNPSTKAQHLPLRKLSWRNC